MTIRKHGEGRVIGTDPPDFSPPIIASEDRPLDPDEALDALDEESFPYEDD